jgi:hypothetical protein
MASIASLYNKFPSLEDADAKFSNRELFFPMLVKVLSGYEDKFAINLVHGHCKLDEGEKMVTTGTITQPMKDVECYPERWLATGEAYVFNTKPTESPPAALLEKFKAVVDVVGHIDGIGILALSYLKNHPLGPGEVYMENTEGRADIMTVVPETQSGMIWTCWKSVRGYLVSLYGCEKSYGGQHKITYAPQDDHEGGGGMPRSSHLPHM